MKYYINTELIFIGCLFLLVIVLQSIQTIKNREFRTEIEELRIIVNQKSLPALILDPLEVR